MSTQHNTSDVWNLLNRPTYALWFYECNFIMHRLCVLTNHAATFRVVTANTCLCIVCWDKSTVKNQTLFIKMPAKWKNSDEHKILEVKNCCLWSDVYRRYMQWITIQFGEQWNSLHGELLRTISSSGWNMLVVTT